MAYGGRGAAPAAAARSAHSIASGIRPATRHKHRQPGGGRGARGRVPGLIVGLPRLAQAFLGRGGPAREEIQRAQQPVPPRARPGGPHPGGKGLGLGHLAVGDQDLQRV